jgi:hypothetical protein
MANYLQDARRRGVFTEPLHSNGGCADIHRKHRSSIVARVFGVSGDVFTELLLRNELH